MVAACSLAVAGAGSAGRAARRRPAGDRVAALDAAGVEEDDVEVVEQLRRQRAELVGHVVDARHARAAGVDDERADAGGRVLRRMARHRDGDGRAVGMGVVQRDDEGAALQVARCTGDHTIGVTGGCVVDGRGAGGRGAGGCAGPPRCCGWPVTSPWPSCDPSAPHARRQDSDSQDDEEQAVFASSSPGPALHVPFGLPRHRSPWRRAVSGRAPRRPGSSPVRGPPRRPGPRRHRGGTRATGWTALADCRGRAVGPAGAPASTLCRLTRPAAPPTGRREPRRGGSGRAGARPTWRAPSAAACPGGACRP